MTSRGLKFAVALLAALSAAAMLIPSCSSGPDKQNGGSSGSGDQTTPADSGKPSTGPGEQPAPPEDEEEQPLGPETKGDVRIPLVAGLDPLAAEAVLAVAGMLKVEFAYREKEGVESPLVASQSPEAGTWAAKGQAVRLVVEAKPAAKKQVPDLSGMTLDQARAALEAASLALGIVTYTKAGSDSDGDTGAGDGSEKPAGEDKPSGGEGDKPAGGEGDKPPGGEGDKPAGGEGDKPAGGEGDKPPGGEEGPGGAGAKAPEAPYVTGQRPEGGTEVHPSAHVDLHLSIPEGADFKVQVPELSGMQAHAAFVALFRSGIRPGRITYAVGDKPAGSVLSQMPSAQTDVVPGSEILIDLSCAAVETAVPDLSGKTFAQAVSELAAVNLGVGEVKPVRGRLDRMNTVSGQSPAAGSAARLGGTVDLSVVLSEAKAPVSRPVASVAAKADGGFTLDAGTSRAFGGRSIVKYVWSLQGAEPRESDSPKVEFAGLAAGSYEFRLVVEDSLGLRSEPAAVDVVVSEAEVAVPDVSGLTAEDAGKALADAGLAAGETAEEESDAQAGLVVRTDPAAGAMAAKGAAVKLFVSAKKPEPVPPVEEKAAVPDVGGLSLDEAKAKIEAAGFKVGNVEEVGPGESDAPGTVVSQEPAAGLEAVKGSEVGLRAFGKKKETGPEPAPAEETSVPDVLGRKIDDAKQAMTDAGLSAGRITPKPGEGEPGTVLSQSPAAGTVVRKGTAVDLEVGAEKPSVQVPDVKGVKGWKAKLKIESMGLKYSASVKEEEGEADVVISMKPEAGTMVEPGSAVEVVVRAAPKPPENVMVPELIGLAPAAARERLENVGLKLGSVEEKEEAGGDGTVVWQSVPCNTSAKRGTPVNVRIRKAPPAPDATVPSVVGLTLVDAGRALEQAGLKVGLTPEEKTRDAKPGTVLRQDPAAGAKAKPGTAVRLVIAQAGAVMVKVPDIRGKTEDEARAELAKAGLSAGEVRKGVAPGGEPEGTVIDQTPMYGREVEAGARIHFTVAVKAPLKVKVPKVVGKLLAAAQDELAKAGLKAGSVSVEDKSGAPKDEVTSQSADPDSEVKPGTVVNLIVSKGPIDKVRAPLILRKSLKEAEDMLKAAGLELGTVSHTVKYAKEIIVRQDPPPNKEVPRGSKVDVEVTITK